MCLCTQRKKVDNFENEIKDLEDKIAELSNNMSEMMVKLMILVSNHINEERQTQQIVVFKCDQCNFHCNKELT